MEFRTQVELPAGGPQLSPRSRCLWIGSCFAERIGCRLPRLQTPQDIPSVIVNPFGVLYNPESIRLGIDTLLESAFDEKYLFRGKDDLWHSWLHNGEFSAEEKKECLSRILSRLLPAARLLRQAEVLFVTFGTSRIYELGAGGFVVGNCHREPATAFTERNLSVEEIVRTWLPLLRRLHQFNPSLQVVFTVSPYRYAKYGMHGSQLSKATLLLSADRLVCAGGKEGLPVSHYFPAYEIVLDELRDYRFFGPDMLHPSETAVDYVWERFRDWTFTSEMRQCAEEWLRLENALRHRPLHPGSKSAHEFHLRTEKLARDFHIRWDITV